MLGSIRKIPRDVAPVDADQYGPAVKAAQYQEQSRQQRFSKMWPILAKALDKTEVYSSDTHRVLPGGCSESSQLYQVGAMGFPLLHARSYPRAPSR